MIHALRFVIVDVGTSSRHRYVDVVYRSREAAEGARADLLKPYPPDHEWRRRLRVEQIEHEPDEEAN